MSDAGIIVIGAIVLLLMGRRSIPWGSGWVWPVSGVSKLTQEFKPGPHRGVDIVGPQGARIIAARSGRVWSVGPTERGWSVVIDHGKPFATFYQHLESANVVRGQVVTAGQPIGVMGIDPTDRQQVRHLHFAVWFEGHGDNASVDPEAVMKTWSRL